MLLKMDRNTQAPILTWEEFKDAVTQYAAKRSVLLGLIGQDIQGSRTPETHMREGEAQGLRLVYRLIDLTKLVGRLPWALV